MYQGETKFSPLLCDIIKVISMLGDFSIDDSMNIVRKYTEIHTLALTHQQHPIMPHP